MANNNNNNAKAEKYHSLVIDSGAIIKQTAFTHLHTSAHNFVTVPAVLSEIRDAQSRAHLEQFQLRLSSLGNGNNDGVPQRLETRLPSQRAIAAVSEFARKTGDYAQLSGVDLQVLALLYEMELEANGGDVRHVRREPKRVLGIRVKPLNAGNAAAGNAAAGNTSTSTAGSSSTTTCGDSIVSGATSGADGASSAAMMQGAHSFFQGDADGMIDPSNVDLEYDDDGDTNGDDNNMDDSVMTEDARSASNNHGNAPKSWAMLVNPTAAPPVATASIHTPAHQIVNESDNQSSNSSNSSGDDDGQFDDADYESDEEENAIHIANADSDEEISDEECDVFVLEPHEAVYLKKLKEEKKKKKKNSTRKNTQNMLAEQLQQHTLEDTGNEGQAVGGAEFPSLSAAAMVPYDGSSDEEEGGENNEDGDGDDGNNNNETIDHEAWLKEEEERKKRALLPMVNGRVQTKPKQYNSFRKYQNIVSPGGSAAASAKNKSQSSSQEKDSPAHNDLGIIQEDSNRATNPAEPIQEYKSRIIGAGGTSSADAFSSNAMTAEDDDGEGWVTCTRDIQTIKSTGSLALSKTNKNSSNSNNGDGAEGRRPNNNKPYGPPISKRAACATTDFAMQNVILQMNLELLTVDGVRVRRLKTWVTRCSACFAIYGGNDDKKGKSGGRLFCDKCGSNALQRIAASVDRNTGRLKLHMKKNYQYNTRGTKFSLPKAGTNNKYEGDLLLCEDQLMYGAWAQKVKKGKSKASCQSIFGSDLASDLGCNTDLTKRDDIRVGFGRRNPNSTKFGRERRGKKKKGATDKACGLRRY